MVWTGLCAGCNQGVHGEVLQSMVRQLSLCFECFSYSLLQKRVDCGIRNTFAVQTVSKILVVSRFSSMR
jgi:hypothetical protein